MRLLLIEDNERLAGLMMAGLMRRGFACDHAPCLGAADEAIAAMEYDALILAERRAVLARRAKADRIADPSFGVRLFSERGGLERGAGIVASMPLGGGYRRATSDQAEAEASAADLDLSRIRRTVEATALADLANVRSRETVWTNMARSAASAGQAANRTARGYQLGQIDLSDSLLVRRQANEARRQEI